MEGVHNQLTSIIDRCIPYKERTVNHKHIKKRSMVDSEHKDLALIKTKSFMLRC